MAGSASKIKLNGFDDLFGSTAVSGADKPFTEISLSELHEFKNHPFKVLDNEQMRYWKRELRNMGFTNNSGR